jgi:SAM-dependent methyltransferase
MTWDDLDWPALDRLRQHFLRGPGIAGAYWEKPDDLASYDLTYGERIGWKWDHVLRELRLRGFAPRSRDVFDWGCGSGIAARRVVSFFGAENFDALTVWDHSPLAAAFAEDAAQRAFPALRVAQATPSLLTANSSIGILLVSHVLNELPPDALASLRDLIARAESVVWVEPGTHAVSRQLGRIRDELRDQFRIVAPCTHELGCPMFAAGNERHWCHFFAPPPSEIFADSHWVKFGQRAGIDLRSLPYCFVAADRSSTRTLDPTWDRGPPIPTSAEPHETRPAPAELSRVIGRVEHFKPYARLLNCDATGLIEFELPKRADPALFKELERTKAPLIYRWRREGDKIVGGQALT